MKRSSPVFEKNAQPITQILSSSLPQQGTILEIGSGSGQHIAHFASSFPHLSWQPSERPSHTKSIQIWQQEHDGDNLFPPLEIDLLTHQWWQSLPSSSYDFILTINVAHIAPFTATQNLIEGASHLLSPHGCVYFYGPWRSLHRTFEPSNAKFDQYLQSLNPEYGIRLFEDLLETASSHNLSLLRDIPMPSNNRSILLQRSP